MTRAIEYDALMGISWVECWKCDACGHRWIKAEGIPAQCASSKCRSRKWNAKTAEPGTYGAIERKPVEPTINQTPNFGVAKVAREIPDVVLSMSLDGDSSLVMCSYTEYDGESGETYRCGLAEHPPKVKHTRGERVTT